MAKKTITKQERWFKKNMCNIAVSLEVREMLRKLIQSDATLRSYTTTIERLIVEHNKKKRK